MMRASITATLVALGISSGLVGCDGASGKTAEASARTSSSSNVESTAMQPNAVPDKVIVYYFHGERRCRTCLGIQETIARTIKDRFAAEIASTALSFQDIDYEAPGNEHFVKEFDLSFSTMVVTARKGQTLVKWENTKVWDYAQDQPALADYTEKQIRAYLAMLKKD